MVHRTDSPEIRDQAINIRATRKQRDLIDQAAHVMNASRSEFILAAASREAENVLLDQVYFRLDEEVYARFTALLDAPPAPTAELRALLNNTVPWE